jgi:hypothetical protein
MLDHLLSHLFFLTRTNPGRSRVARGIQFVNHAATTQYPLLGRLAISRTNQHSLSISRVRMTPYSTPGKAHRSRRKLMLGPNLAPQPHPVHLPLPTPNVFHLQRDNVVLIFFSLPHLPLFLVDVLMSRCVSVSCDHTCRCATNHNVVRFRFFSRRCSISPRCDSRRGARES